MLTDRIVSATVVVVAIVVSGPVHARTQPQPYLVKDIRVSQGSVPQEITALGSRAYFTLLSEPVYGKELWVTDGTEEGTEVFEIIPGEDDGSLLNLCAVGGKLFFSARTAVFGRELWMHDPATGTTQLVADIYPGTSSSYPQDLADIGGVLYFNANDGVFGKELWAYDPSTPSTPPAMAADIREGSNSSDPSRITAAGGYIYCTASGLASGTELWQLDPQTGVLTEFVIREGSSGAFGWTDEMVAVGNTLFFSANDGTLGNELFELDTTTGVIRNFDMAVDSRDSNPQDLVVLGGMLYFAASDPPDSAYGDELWMVAPGGSPVVVDVRPGDLGSRPRDLIVVGDDLCFSAYTDEYGSEIYRYRPADGSIGVLDAVPGPDGAPSSDQAATSSLLFFAKSDAATGRELWIADVASGVLSDPVDIWPGSTSSSPRHLTAVADAVFFRADDGTRGEELWMSDGTVDGTQLVADLFTGTNRAWPRELVALGESILFRASAGRVSIPTSLFLSDGTESGTESIELEPNVPASPEAMTRVGDRVFFYATDDCSSNSNDGIELWATDGSANGTYQVKDINPGGDSNILGCSYCFTPIATANLSDLVFLFSADDGEHGSELWRSDGSPGGTFLVRDVFDGNRSSGVIDLTPSGSVAYFTADDGVNGRELWKTDGSPAPDGAWLLEDIRPGQSGSDPDWLTPINQRLFFGADDGTHGSELWVHIADPLETRMVVDLQPDVAGSFPSDLVLGSDGKLYFSADIPGAGRELLVHSPETGLTSMVADIRAGEAGSSPSQLVVVDGAVLFSADDGVSGRELWAHFLGGATAMVEDVLPGPEGADPDRLVAIGGEVFFNADDGSSGREPWVSDGTSEGTRRLGDIDTNERDSDPMYFTLAGGRVFFSAEEPRTGRELWAFVQCPADLTGDGLVNTQDFIAFLNAWATGDPLADWNDDGNINTQDFIAYLNDWAAGC